MLDSAHFRFIQLDGNFIRFYNEAIKENVEWEKFSIEFDSEEDAELKFEELSKEAGWFSFLRKNQRTLLNTFCFSRFFLSSDVDSDGVKTYSVVFWNSGDDKFRIKFKDRNKGIELLKSLAI